MCPPLQCPREHPRRKTAPRHVHLDNVHVNTLLRKTALICVHLDDVHVNTLVRKLFRDAFLTSHFHNGNVNAVVRTLLRDAFLRSFHAHLWLLSLKSLESALLRSTLRHAEIQQGRTETSTSFSASSITSSSTSGMCSGTAPAWDGWWNSSSTSINHGVLTVGCCNDGSTTSGRKRVQRCVSTRSRFVLQIAVARWGRPCVCGRQSLALSQNFQGTCIRSRCRDGSGARGADPCKLVRALWDCMSRQL